MKQFRLGLFGDTRSGKTMYLTALYEAAQSGTLPPRVNLTPEPGSSLAHLHDRLSRIRAGQWPPGDLDVEPIELRLDYQGDCYQLRTKDFKGGDFGDLADPKSKLDFERFIAELFDGCSAYVFLVDPGVLIRAEEPGLSQHEAYRRRLESLRVTTAIEAALEKLRRANTTSHLFHRPVAVVFTKCDMYPEVKSRPDQFARRFMNPVCNYLQEHCPKRHKFFAASSTGPIPNGEAHAPPSRLQSDGILTPLLWCVDQHRNRHRVLKWTLIAVAVALLLLSYGGFHWRNAAVLETMRREIGSAEDGRLAELFMEATQQTDNFAMSLTHPHERERVRQSVAEEAKRRFDNFADKRVAAATGPKTIADFKELALATEEFQTRYRGAAQAGDTRTAFELWRRQLTDRYVVELEALARDGKEEAFNRALSAYREIGADDKTSRVQAAQDELGRKVTRGKLQLLFHARIDKPSDVENIRRLCRDAEEEIRRLKLGSATQEAQYVNQVRDFYDALRDESGAERKIHFVIEKPTTHTIQWWLYASNQPGAKLLAQNNAFQSLVKSPGKTDSYSLTSRELAVVDLFHLEKLHLKIEERYWFPKKNGHPELVVNLRTIKFGVPEPVIADYDTKMHVTFFDDGHIAESIASLREIERREDELFRGK